MSEINIKITEISNAIEKLRELQSKFNSRNTTPPSTVGGGNTVNELENIAGVYKTLNRDFSELLSNTIAFLNNVKTSYEESDQKARRAISKSGGGLSGGGGAF